MGESESSMDAPISLNSQMEDSEASFEVSVSFGRFDNDLLAWEKWSTFPSNKYLEEVEKCSTPGSVAQKKAYFEAHYKKVAAQKAEQEEQDKREENVARDRVDSELKAQPQKDLVAKFCEVELDNEVADLGSEMSSDQNNVDEPKEVIDMVNESLPVLDNEVADLGIEMSSGQNNVDEPREVIDMVNESLPVFDAGKSDEQKSVSGVELDVEVISLDSENIDMVNDSKDFVPVLDKEKLNDMNSISEIELENGVTDLASEMKSDQVDEPKDNLDMINEELPSMCSEGAEEMPKHINAKEIVSVEKEQKNKSDRMSKSKKATTIATKKANSTIPLKKKPVAYTPKSSLLSTPKFSRSSMSKSTMSESKGLSKKEYGTSPLISKKGSKTDSRREAPTSLHMSLRLSAEVPTNSEPAPSTTMRKSVFMEKMGDKDIVKRAFRAFRNDLNQLPSSSPDKPTLANQIPGKETSVKASVVGTPQKKIEGVKNVVKKTPQSSQSGDSGLRKTSNSSRLPHTANQRNASSVSSTYGLRSHDKPEKRNELSKKLEEKANGKAAEKTQSQSKLKKEAEVKRQDHYTKAKPIVGTAKPKSSLDKKSAK